MASINPPAVSPGDDTEVAWANRVVSHVVATFATVAERGQQIPSPEPGRVCYLESTKQLEMWNGAAWVPVGHGVYLPLAGGTMTGDLQLTTIRSVGGQPVLNAPAGGPVYLFDGKNPRAAMTIASTGVTFVPPIVGYMPLSGGTLTGDLMLTTIRTVGQSPVLNAPSGGPVYLYDGKNPAAAVTIADTAFKVRDKVTLAGPGISYEGSTHGGGGVNAIGFRWAGGLLKAVVDNAHTYTLANDTKFASYLPLAGGTLTGSLRVTGTLTASTVQGVTGLTLRMGDGKPVIAGAIGGPVYLYNGIDSGPAASFISHGMLMARQNPDSSVVRNSTITSVMPTGGKSGDVWFHRTTPNGIVDVYVNDAGVWYGKSH